MTDKVSDADQVQRRLLNLMERLCDPDDGRSIEIIRKCYDAVIAAKDAEIEQLKAELSDMKDHLHETTLQWKQLKFAIAAKDAEIKRLRAALRRISDYDVPEARAMIDIARAALKEGT